MRRQPAVENEMEFPPLPDTEQSRRLTHPPSVPIGSAVGAAMFAANAVRVQASDRATRGRAGALR